MIDDEQCDYEFQELLLSGSDFKSCLISFGLATNTEPPFCSFFDWLLTQRRGKSGHQMGGTKQCSSLKSCLKNFRLVYMTGAASSQLVLLFVSEDWFRID